MKRLLKKCSIIEANDLEYSNFEETFDIISANPEKIFLLGTDVRQKLNEVIGKIYDFSQSEDKSIDLISYRFAYEIEFKYQVLLKNEYKKDEIEVKTFSNLLEKIECDSDNFSIDKERKYLIVINDKNEKEENIQKELATLLQQFVFLNLDIDICTSSDFVRKKIKDKFRQDYKSIKESFDIFNKKILELQENKDLSEFLVNKIINISECLKKIKDELIRAEERPIRIAVMGTKKAGKSVIINSLLNCDYVPTSSELPTPNNIFYMPNDKDDRLYLEYDKTREFENSNELKKFVKQEFDMAKKNGSALADMTIRYPSNDLTSFEIIDTPGPNFAVVKSQHSQKADEAIRKADVCVFVIDYTKHLTDDEKDFLKKVHDWFKENNKFYSFFIAINKIDGRFLDNHEKSVVRVVDYIHDSLQKLNFRNIISFGTSSLQSFYLEKIRQLLDNDSKLEDISESSIKCLKKKYKGKDDKITALSFIDTSLRQMCDFYEYDAPNGRQLDWFSGMPQLKKYCRYIGEEKADTEIVNNAINKINRQISIISNNVQTSEIQKIANENNSEVKKLFSLLTEFKSIVKNIFGELEIRIENQNRENIKKSIKEDREEQYNRIYKSTYKPRWSRYLSDSIKFNDYNISLFKKTLKNIQEKIDTEFIPSIIEEIKNISVDTTVEIIEQLNKEINESLNTTEEKLKKQVVIIENKLENKKIQDMFHNSFMIPTFSVELNHNIPIYDSNSGKVIIYNLERILSENKKIKTEIYWDDEERDPEGFLEWLCSLFGKKYTEKVRKEREVEIYNFYEINNRIQVYFINYIKTQLDKVNNIIWEELEKKIDSNLENVLNEVTEVKQDYEKMTQGYIDDLNLVIVRKQEYIENLKNEIKELDILKSQIEPISIYFKKEV